MKKIHWRSVGEQGGMWAWISSDEALLVWTSDRAKVPPAYTDREHGAWNVARVLEPDFNGWADNDIKPSQELIRKWLARKKPWGKLVNRVRTYQERMRG